MFKRIGTRCLTGWTKLSTLSLEYGLHFPWGWGAGTTGSGPVAALTGTWHQALPPTDSHPHSGFLWGPGLGPASPAPPTVFTSHPATNTPYSVHKSPSYKHHLQCSQVTQLAWHPSAPFTSHPASPAPSAVFTSHPASPVPPAVFTSQRSATLSGGNCPKSDWSSRCPCSH